MSPVSTLIRASKQCRRFTVWTVQILAIAVSGTSAFLLRFDLVLPHAIIPHLVVALAIWVAVKTLVFHFAGLHRGWWQYVSLGDILRILMGNIAGSALSLLAILLVAPTGFPRSVYPLDLMLCFLSLVGLRVWARIWAEAGQGPRIAAENRTLIYGAGDAGQMLLREIRKNARMPYHVIGFLDDRPDKLGIRILGIPVMGTGQHAASIASKQRAVTILIAIPSATGAEMTRILDLCHAARVECKTVRGFDEMIQSNGLASHVRDVAVEDLLGRHPVRIEEDTIRRVVENNVVLVTGAAGSIGSELCRQIARFSPASIIGFDIGESPLFEVDRAFRSAFPGVPFYPEVGSIQNRRRVDEVIRRYRPSVIYHAAAYKHVPMMESCVFEAIENNVLGTYTLALAAAEFEIANFVLISSDKAVRPTNIMGATKRVAELMLLCFPWSGTRFIAVRFGNVLGSSGSVIPIFKQQIAAGGPVTVTHPEMRRYFMTIPEATQLVLQASATARNGEICVLDMGEPVKIVDLARNLILLSGLRPGVDIPIEFSGIRPGEKLYEELSTVLEDTAPTTHSRVHTYTGSGLSGSDMSSHIDVLQDICQRRDLGSLVLMLKELVPDYSPSAHLLRQVVEASTSKAIGVSV